MVRQHPSFDHRRWRKVRLEALERAGFRCQACNATSETAQLQVDHIVEIRDMRLEDPRVYELGNLQVLCASCHTTKSNKMREIRGGNTTPVAKNLWLRAHKQAKRMENCKKRRLRHADKHLRLV